MSSSAEREREQDERVLETLSGDFAFKLRGQHPPRIEDVLANVALDQREALLRMLIAVELAEGGRTGKESSKQEYLDRFPQYRSCLEEMFAGTMSDEQGSVDTDSMAPTAHFSMPESRRMGNYVLEGELGRGGMGVVHFARHADGGETVALKVLPEVDGASLHRFKREFRSLADLSHPNLISLFNLESDGEHWFFTMELLRGANSFREYVRPRGELDQPRLRRALAQLASGVQALHDHGVIHRDLKPSNVMVDPDGRVVLLDFGLVSEQNRQNLTLSEQKLSGTPAYMAPETAGGQEETVACDWYAVGVMLYESLCGHLPFTGKALEILFDKRSHDAPALPVSEVIPQDLAELCAGLVRRDPQQRPTHQQIADIVSEAGATELSELKVIQHELVGRDTQLKALGDCYAEVCQSQQPMAVFVSGRSGEGKSVLIDRFLSDLHHQHDDVTFLTGRCYDREIVPFKALDSLVDALASYVRTLESTSAAVLLPDDVTLLAKLFPVVSRIEVVGMMPEPLLAGLSEQQIRKRAFAALRELIRRIGQKSVVVMFSDDVQWGDADSAEILFDILGGESAPRVLFIGSFRVDEAGSSSFLNKWDRLTETGDVSIASRSITVGPLDQQTCRQLVSQRIGQESDCIDDLAQDLFSKTGGNAFIVNELLDCYDAQSQSIEALSIREVIARKLERLDSDAESLLTAIAVSGKAIADHEAITAAGISASTVSLLTHMRNLRLIRLIGDQHEQRLDTYHDKIRESMIAGLDEDSLCQWHGKLADTIESVPGASEIRASDLAYHFDTAGNRERSHHYALIAGHQAREKMAHQVAVQQFEIGYRNSDGGVRQQGSYPLAEAYAHSLMLVGQYDQARQILDEGQLCTGEAIELARFQELLGEIAFKQGQILASLSHFENGLRLLGTWVPSSQLGQILDINRQLSINLWHSLFPGRCFRGESSPRANATIRMLTRMVLTTAFADGIRMVWSVLSGVNVAERYPKSTELGFGYTFYAAALNVTGFHHRASGYHNRALEIRREAQDQWGIGHALIWSGIGAFAKGDYETAIDLLRRASEMLMSLGDVWEVNIARFHISVSLYQLGRLDEAIEEAHRTFERSLRYRDARTNCSLYILAKASNGQVDFAKYQERVVAAPEDVLATCNLSKGLGIWHLAHRRFDESMQCMSSACELPLAQRVPNYHTIAGLPLSVSAKRRYAESLPRGTPEFRQALASAHRLGRRAVWICKRFPTEHALALREFGEICRLRGKHQKAMRFFDKSSNVAESQAESYELAKTNLAKAKLAQEMGLPESDALLSEAEAEMQRFDAMIAEGLARIQ